MNETTKIGWDIKVKKIIANEDIISIYILILNEMVSINHY